MSIRNLVLLSSFLSFPLAAHAQITQFIPFTGTAQEMRLTMNPSDPRPGDSVQLTIESDNIDIDRSLVVWYANDVEFARGDGLKEATIIAGPLSSETRIDVVAESDTATGDASARIHPLDISFLWQSDSYVPPFYRGRALPGTSAIIRVYALARLQQNKMLIPEKNIIYNWFLNGTKVASASGRGKSSATFHNTARFNSDVVRVDVESLDGNSTGSLSVRIPRVEPELLLYENHPLFGVLFHRAIVGDVNTKEREQRVSAFPYFANVRTPNDAALNFEWNVNEKEITPNTNEPNTLTITTENYAGPAVVALSLTSENDLLMRAIGTWRIIFGESSGAFFETRGFGQ